MQVYWISAIKFDKQFCLEFLIVKDISVLYSSLTPYILFKNFIYHVYYLKKEKRKKKKKKKKKKHPDITAVNYKNKNPPL